ELILIRRHVLALEPDWRAHGAIGADGVSGPVAARIVEIEPARERHGNDLAGELFGEQQSEFFHRLVVAGAAMQKKEADPLAVGSARDGVRGLRLADPHPAVPLRPTRPEADAG